MTEKRAVILTAIPCEYAAVRRRLLECVEVVHPSGTIYEKGVFGDWAVFVAELGAGNERAAAEAERAIELHKPHVIFFVGVAGGIKDVALGDVVAATKVYGYESGKEQLGFHPRPHVHNAAAPLESRARAESRKPEWHDFREPESKLRRALPKVYVGPIAAGSKVVASNRSATAEFLKSQYSDALAVEMEGIGFLTAASLTPSCYAMVIRGISDLIDGKNASDADGWQEVAADHASAFAFQMLLRLDANLLLHP